MTNVVGKEQIREFVERIEVIDGEIGAAKEDRKAVLAEAKAGGFDVQALGRLIKRRKLKPHDAQESDAMDEMYRYAMGMADEPPLLRAMRAAEADTASSQSVLDQFKKFCPAEGSVEVVMAGKRWQISRDHEGVAHVSEVQKPASASSPFAPEAPAPRRRAAPEAPNVEPDEAEAMGETAGEQNVPVIKNPFPYGDPRRARWDTGWRRGANSDGMGPADDD